MLFQKEFQHIVKLPVATPSKYLLKNLSEMMNGEKSNEPIRK